MSSEDDDDEEESEEDSSDEDPASQMIKASRREAVERIKAERKAEKHAEKAKAKQFAKDRKKKKVNLNKLTSISGSGGDIVSSGSRGSIACYTCGGPHVAAKCPQQEKKRHYPGGGEDGPSRKVIKTR